LLDHATIHWRRMLGSTLDVEFDPGLRSYVPKVADVLANEVRHDNLAR
jgi:hypothetical protein